MAGWFKHLYDVPGLLQHLVSMGPVWAHLMLGLIVFTETGLMVGFFLPGDSLLFTAGLACAPGNALLGETHLNFLALNATLVPAAIIGDTVGYWIGRKAGVPLYRREKTLFFRRDHLLATRDFYERHGGKTIVIARFVPLIRTFAPVVAGVADMPYRIFVFYNILGGVGWVIGLTVAGYLLGRIDWIRTHLEATIMLIILVSLLPAILTLLRHRGPVPHPAAKPEVS